MYPCGHFGFFLIKNQYRNKNTFAAGNNKIKNKLKNKERIELFVHTHFLRNSPIPGKAFTDNSEIIGLA